MTIQEIRDELKPVKPLSRERLYFYFRKFKIKPLSHTVRLKPQQYPQDTVLRLKLKLGLTPTKNRELVFKLHGIPNRTSKQSRR